MRNRDSPLAAAAAGRAPASPPGEEAARSPRHSSARAEDIIVLDSVSPQRSDVGDAKPVETQQQNHRFGPQALIARLSERRRRRENPDDLGLSVGLAWLRF